MTWSAWDLTTVSGPTGALPDLDRQGRRTSSSPFNPFALSLALIHTTLSCKLPLRVHMSYAQDPSPVGVVEGGVREGRGRGSRAQPYAKPQATVAHLHPCLCSVSDTVCSWFQYITLGNVMWMFFGRKTKTSPT